MGRQFGALATSIAGAAIGGPWGAAITLAGGVLFAPKQPGQEVGRISGYQNLLTEKSGYGEFIPEIYGTMQVAGNIIDCRYVNGVATGIEQFATSSNGSGNSFTGHHGGAPPTGPTTTFYYYITAAWLWGRGPLFVDKLLLEDDAGLHTIYDRDGGTTRAKGFDLTVQNDALSNPCGEVGLDSYGHSAGLHNWYGTDTQPVDSYLESFHGTGNVPAYRNNAYTVLYRYQLTHGYRGLWAIVRNATNDVQTIVSDRLQRAGIPTGRIHLTQLQGTIDGCAVTQLEGASRLIETLCGFNLCSMACIDGLVVDRSRANPLIVSCPDKWMGAHEETGSGDSGQSADPLIVHPIKSTDLPSEIQITFQDKNLRYNLNTAIAKRETANYVNVQAVDMGAIAGELVPMTRLAQVFLDEQWMGQNTYETNLLPAMMRVAPGDVLNVPDLTGNTPGVVEFMVSEQEISPDGILNCKGPRFDDGVYGQYVAPDQNVLPPATVILNTPPSTIVYDDVPLNDDMAGAPSILIAATTAGNWDGAQLLSSEVTGFGNQNIAQRAVMGVTLGAYSFTDADTLKFRYDVTIHLRLTYGGVGAAASEEFLRLNQANVLLLGTEAGGWTALQFVDVTQINATDFDISGILPGLRGSDHVQSFASGVKVLLLHDETGATASGISPPIKLANRVIGQTVNYSVVPGGNPSADATPQSLVFAGNSVKPLSPVYVHIDRSTAGQKTFIWHPRSRLDMGPNPSIQPASDPDNFVLVYGDGVTSVTVNVTGARQLTVLDSVITSQLGSVPGTFQGSVTQVNSIVGKGWVRNYSGA